MEIQYSPYDLTAGIYKVIAFFVLHVCLFFSKYIKTFLSIIGKQN